MDRLLRVSILPAPFNYILKVVCFFYVIVFLLLLGTQIDTLGWDATVMERAIEAVTSGRMAFKTAATSFNVPRTTLRRRVGNKNLRATGNKKSLGRFQTVFTAEQEQELVDHILKMEVRLYGVTVKDLQYFAYQMAEV